MALKPLMSSRQRSSPSILCILDETAQDFSLQTDNTVQLLWFSFQLVARLLDEDGHGLGPELHRAVVRFRAWCDVCCLLWMRGPCLASHAGLTSCPCSTLSSMPAHVWNTSQYLPFDHCMQQALLWSLSDIHACSAYDESACQLGRSAAHLAPMLPPGVGCACASDAAGLLVLAPCINLACDCAAAAAAPWSRKRLGNALAC